MLLTLAVFYRKTMSKFLYWIIRKTIHRGPLENIWDGVKNLSMQDFSAYINKYPYKADPLWGLPDYTIQEPNYFFRDDLRFGRDCSDFAQMWYWWAKENGYWAWKVLLYDGWNLKSGHATCVIFIDGKYYLADYWIRGEYDTLNQAIEQFRKQELVEYGKYERLQWTTF